MNKIGNEINELILDLAVDEFYKYNQNRGLNFTFWQMQKYFFCCDCCKNKNQIQLEKTYKRALDELFKSIDIVNVIKCTQQIKVLKEIIFDPTQREIFNHLLRTTIDGENVISSFNTEISSKLDSIEEDHILQKSSLKDSFVQLSKQDCYNSTELKLIDILYLDPGLKKKFFNHEEKDPNNKINLYKYLNTTVFNQNNNLSKHFDLLVSLVEKELIVINQIIDESIDECNEICKVFKVMCDENKILKDILYNSSDKGINPKIKKLTNFHPILNSKEKIDRQIKLMRLLHTNNDKNQIIQNEGFIVRFFNFIELIFCIKKSEEYINKFYNKHTLLTLRSISHCIKLGFLCLLIFLPFNIVTFIYNKDLLNTDYQDDIMGFGYLSFSRKPSDNKFIIRFYVISLIICIIVFFSYILFLLIQKYLNGTESNFIDSNYPLSKFLFTLPTLKINDEEERKFYQNYLLIESLHITDHLYKIPTKSTIINFLIFTINIILISLNLAVTLFLASITPQLEDLFDGYGYLTKIIFVSFLQALSRNIFANLIQSAVTFHVDLIPETLEKLKFWMPFIAKSSATTLNVLINFNGFMGTDGNLLSAFTTKFDKNYFICKEDQASNNMIIYMLTEFFLRKTSTILSYFISFKKQQKYNLDSVIINVMTSFYIMNMITLIYPAQGLFSVFVFSFEYLSEMFILVYFKPVVMSILKPETYEGYNIFSLTLNLASVLIVNIIYQNQYQWLNNDNEYVVNDPSNPPILCFHKQESDDFFHIFYELLGNSLKAFIQTVQMFIFIPSVIIIYQILINSKELIKRYLSNLKYLLRMINDVNPNRIFERVHQNKDALHKIFEEYDNKKNEIVRLAQSQKKTNNPVSLIKEDEGEDDIKIG